MSTLKNKLLKLIMTGMLVFAAFSFVSCGGNEAGGGDDSGGGEPGEISGGGGEESGGNPGGGASVGGSGEILTEEQASAKLNTIGDYVIIAEAESEEFEVGCKGNTYWSIHDGYGQAFVIAGELIHSYDGYEDTDGTIKWEFGASASYTEEDFDSDIKELQSGFSTWLFFASDKTGFTEAGSETIAGRPCTRYTQSESVAIGGQYASASQNLYIDNATGITMKYEISGSSNEGSASVSYTVKSFKTGNDVVAPDLPAPAAND